MRAGYGEKIRDFFAHNTNPMLFVDFAGVKIFDSATVDTNILLLKSQLISIIQFALLPKIRAKIASII